MEASIGIYQPFYKPALIERLDPGFIPLDWRSNPAPALRELALHHHIAINKLYESHRLTGLLSPKFFTKTGLHSGQVYDWVAKNPGHDIYLISGGPHVPYVHFNGVVRNQKLHSPLFEEQMRDVCARIGFQLPNEFPRQANSNRSGCSYWVASKRFWENWIADVIAPIFELIGNSSGQKGLDALYYPWNARSILSRDYPLPVRAYLEEMIPIADRIDAMGQWSDSDKAWLVERYAALIGDGVEVLATDPADYDLPRHFPAQGRFK